MSIEKAKAELQAAMSGPAGRQWVYGPAVSAVLAALEQAEHQLAEANHPHTGDWLYDDPIELAKAIRKGPDMPEASGNSPAVPDGWIMVPVEPTEAMMLHKSGCQHHAWNDPDCAMRQTRRLVWANMLAAAPKQESE